MGRIAALLLACTWWTAAAAPGGAAPVAETACPSTAQLQYFTGANQLVCPCFGSGEQAGVVFTAPALDYPLEILRVGIAWGSASGGTASSLEEALHVYPSGLPNPGTPIFTLEGPVMNDGAFNEFDLEPQPGAIVINSGSFSVTLEFLNANAGNQFAPSVVSDGNGCQSGKNLVYAIPGGWFNACQLGVSGDWLFYVVYGPCVPSTGVEPNERVLSSSPVVLMAPWPNPSRGEVDVEFVLAAEGSARLDVHDLAGRRVARLADGAFEAGRHHVRWDERAGVGRIAPGMYFLELTAAGRRVRRSVLIAR